MKRKFDDECNQISANEYKITRADNKTFHSIREDEEIAADPIQEIVDLFDFTGSTSLEEIVKRVVECTNSARNDALKKRKAGFTRCRSLVLLPFRNTAFRFIQILERVSELEIEGIDRLNNEYFAMPTFKNKSEDYMETFAGNIDDNFKLGIKVKRKQLKLFSGFFQSDIIIASPVALHAEIEKGDFDFLSSIEFFAIYDAHILLMQNFQHVHSIMQHVNLTPIKDHGIDFSNILDYFLDGKQKFKRQTVVASNFQTPELFSLTQYCFNVNGRQIISDAYKGLISKVKVHVPMVFQRIKDCSPIEVYDTRFEFFKSKVLTQIQDQAHVLLVVPSYFDFLRLKSFLKKNGSEFGKISEYSSRSTCDKARHYFEKGEFKLLMVTERHYFYKRTKFKGIKHLIYYGPTVFEYFHEFANMMEDSTVENNVLVIYSKYDQMALERIVGSDKVIRMISGEKSTFMITI